MSEEQQLNQTPREPLPWKTILYTGAILGILALVASVYKPGFTQLASSFAMLFAVYYIQPKVKSRRLLIGFLASTLAGVISWIGIFIFHPDLLVYSPTAPVFPQILRTFGATFLPMWLMISIGLSWINQWVVQRGEKRREEVLKKQREEKRVEREALNPRRLNATKKKYKKKKKK